MIVPDESRFQKDRTHDFIGAGWKTVDIDFIRRIIMKKYGSSTLNILSTEHADFENNTVQYMVLDFRIKALLSNSGDKSVKVMAQASNNFTLTSTVQEAPTGKLETFKNEDGSSGYHLFYSVPASKGEEKAVRMILKLLVVNGGGVNVTVSISDGGNTSVTGQTNANASFAIPSLNLEFILQNDGTYKVSGMGTCKHTNVAIPSVHNGKPVTGVGEAAFRDCTALTGVIIPDSVTKIAALAFQGCTGLTDIVIPGSVTQIGGSVFQGCTGLTDIVIPDSVTSIAAYAFADCTNLTDITIPDGVKSIGAYAFCGCTGLTSIDIPGSVTVIGNSAFRSCGYLTELIIHPGLKSIGEAAFMYCSSLTSITFPDSVTNIGNSAFMECFGLTEIHISDSVTVIESCAFFHCVGLESIIYSGTKAQWAAVELNSSWDFATGNYTVICADGTVAK